MVRTEVCSVPRISKHPIFKDSCPTKPLRVWLVEPETINVGYLELLGKPGLSFSRTR